MCGWPAGVGYPPAEDELDQVTTSETITPEAVDEEPDHVGVQLDALAGMVARQGQSLSPNEDTTDATVDLDPEEPVAEDVPEDTTPDLDVPAIALTQGADPRDEAPDDDDIRGAAQEVDPLTAPLAALTGAAVATATASQGASPATTDQVEPATAPDDVLEPITDETGDELESSAPNDSHATETAGQASAILRPAQLLVVATAALNLILVGLNAVLGTSSGSVSVVTLGAALITLAVWTGATVTFLHWVSRAHSHVAATAASRQRHGASMSLIGWFIPIAGFVIGYRVLQDLWTGSDPATRQDADAPPAKVRTIDLWLLGIVTAALFGYAMPLALGDSALWSGISALGLLVAALSLASTMGSISAWQLDQQDAAAQDEAAPSADSGVENDVAVSADELERPNPVPSPEPVSAER